MKKTLIVTNYIIGLMLGGGNYAGAFTYPDFSATSGVNLVDNAAQAGSFVRLTPASPTQSGALWFSHKQFVAGGFDTTFSFRISDPGGPFGGGDGIAFSIQSFSPLSSGSEFGAASNQVSVSFNTFNNFGDEPSDSFVGIVTNQYAAVRYSQTFDLNPTAIRLKDGAVHTATFHYDSNGLDLRLDDISIFEDLNIPLNQGIDGSGNAWVGFSARCGDAYENQDILSWTFSASEPGTGGVQLTTYCALDVNLTTYTQSGGANSQPIAAPPQVRKLINAVLLKQLAQDLYSSGEWESNSFPRGATLVVSSPQLACVVMQGKNVLIDVSDLLRIQSTGSVKLFWGATDNLGGPAPIYREARTIMLSYNGTGNLQFTAQGIGDLVRSGSSSDTIVSITVSLSGEGNYGPDKPFLVKGCATIRGHEKFVPED